MLNNVDDIYYLFIYDLDVCIYINISEYHHNIYYYLL
jgi:hypothetical protein